MLMQHRKLLIHLFCFFIVFQQGLLGQYPGYYVQHFNSENGLPNTIKGMEADSSGFVWIATEAGLVRFDGSRFKMYDRAETGEQVARLFNLGISAAGEIFTNVQYKGYYYITASNTLKHISESELFQNEKPPAGIAGIADRLLGGYKKRYKSGLVDERFRPAWGNNKGSYFTSVALAGGFYYYINANNEVIVADTSLENFTSVSITGIPQKENGKADSVPVTVFNKDEQVYLRKADTVYRLCFSAGKKSALATALLFVGDIPNITGLLQLPGSITTIVSTSTDGIYVFKKQDFTTLKLNDRDANVFYAQAPFGEDGVMTSKGVLMPGKFIPFKDNFFAYSVLKTSNNIYYLNRRGVDTFGFCLINQRLEKVAEIPVASGGINCIRQLSDGSIWVSASGKFMGRLEESRIQWYERPAGLSPDFLINTFVEASPDQFWIGGVQGLARVDVISQNTELVSELKNAYVRSLYADATGALWIGTYGSGFYAWYKNKLVAFPPDANGYLKYVHSFMPDRSGRLWISTNHGLFVFALNDLYEYLDSKKQPPYYYYFDNSAGFLTNEFNGGCTPAGIILGNGKFSLPSLNGLVQFFPDSIKPVLPGAEIFIDNIVADTSAIPISGEAIMVPHGVNRLQVHISSPYFGNSYNQNIEYSLDEERDKWYRLNDNYIIELNNLRKGRHSIALRKKAGFGENNFITKEIVFTVQPAFTETMLFKIIILTAFLLFLYFLYRLRIRFLIKQKERLEKEVFEKTKEQHALISNLETVVAELEQSKDDLQKTVMFKETLAMIITHDLQSPLRFLSDAMERMHSINKNGDADTKELSVELKNTSANIHHFVEEFAVWIKKVNIAGNLNFKMVNLVELLAELEIFFSELQKTNGNKIIIETSPAVNVYADYQLMKIILRNIIDNANKHTHDGTIHIQLCVSKNMATIKITDAGEGMKPEVLQKLIQRTQQQTSFDYNKEINGIGFGYRFVTDFCRMLDISLDIKSQLAKGTTVILSNLKTGTINNS